MKNMEKVRKFLGIHNKFDSTFYIMNISMLLTLIVGGIFSLDTREHNLGNLVATGLFFVEALIGLISIIAIKIKEYLKNKKHESEQGIENKGILYDIKGSYRKLDKYSKAIGFIITPTAVTTIVFMVWGTGYIPGNVVDKITIPLMFVEFLSMLVLAYMGDKYKKEEQMSVENKERKG